MGDRTERHRDAADMIGRAVESARHGPGLTRSTENKVVEKDYCAGGLVRSLQLVGAIFLCLASLCLAAGVVCLCLGDHTEIVLGMFASAFTLIITGMVFFWMFEMLYLLRRIDAR